MIATGLKLVSINAAFLVLQACGTNGGMTKASTEGVKQETHAMTTIKTGTLTDEGVVCQAMRGDDGELYTFEAMPEGLKTGDKISVVKSTTNFEILSTCDQGKVLHWDSITLLSSDGKSKTTWNYDDL